LSTSCTSSPRRSSTLSILLVMLLAVLSWTSVSLTHQRYVLKGRRRSLLAWHIRWRLRGTLILMCPRHSMVLILVLRLLALLRSLRRIAFRAIRSRSLVPCVNASSLQNYIGSVVLRSRFHLLLWVDLAIRSLTIGRWISVLSHIRAVPVL